MIDPKELRIGNWVMHEGKPYQITTGQQIDIYSNHFEAIMLTTVLLEKCGFEYEKEEEIPDKLYVSDEEYQINVIDDKFEFHYPSLYQGIIILESFHHFQNVYYFLDGDELEIDFEIQFLE